MCKPTILLLLAFAFFASAAFGKSADQDFYASPIVFADAQKTALDYHQIPVDLESSQAREPLVDLASYKIAGNCYYARSDKLNAPYYKSFAGAPAKLYLRKTPAEKLVAVNKALKPYGVEVFVLDGWRPVELQKALWDYFIDKARQAMPFALPSDWTKYAGRFCSNPQGFNQADGRTWPSHVTGGAVDLTLRSLISGELLYMGGIFDDASPVSRTDYYESHSTADGVKSQSFYAARQNRRLLYFAMRQAGFANYPYEWWHFDFGNQMWVQDLANGKGACAHYGACSP